MDRFSLMMSRGKFHEALVHGDLAAVEAFFSHSHVREEIQSTNMLVMETRPTNPTTFTLPDGTLPWFRERPKYPNDPYEFPLRYAACNGHAHILEWFFSHENTELMGATLALLLPKLAIDDGPIIARKPGDGDALVMEALLQSRVFTALVADETKQSLLDAIAAHCQIPAVLEVLLAHGARLNSARAVVARYGVEALTTEYAFLVGADVLVAPSALWTRVHAMDSFLEGGGDVNETTLAIIADATYRTLGEVERLLEDGFFDVDTRNEYGRTALMMMTNGPRLSYAPYEEERRINHIVMTLLTLNCDVNSFDDAGRTALHHAICNADWIDVTELLFDWEADASIRDSYGAAPYDLLLDEQRDWHMVVEYIDAYLKFGGDPFATPPPPARRSLYDCLLESEEGREYIQTHPEVFQQRGIADRPFHNRE